MKKRMITMALLALSAAGQAQPGKANTTTTVTGSFTLTGDITGLTADKVYLNSTAPISHEKISDTALIQDGKFTFTGHVVRPMYAALMTPDGSFRAQLWLENSTMTITGVTGHPVNVTGSATQDVMNAWDKSFAPLKKEYNARYMQVKDAKESGDKTLLKQREAELYDIQIVRYKALCEQLVKEYPRSYFTLNQVYNCGVMDKYRYEDLSRFYGYLSEDLKQTPMGKSIASRLDILKWTAVGQPFPDYSQPDIDGNIVKIADYKGKYLLLTFGGGGVTQYRNELDARRQWYAQYHGKGLEFLDVLFEKNKDGLQKAIDDNKLPWKQVSDCKEFGNDAKRFSIETIPQSFLIDPQGVIIAVDLTEQGWAEKLKEVIK